MTRLEELEREVKALKHALENIEPHFGQALRQWRMFSDESTKYRDIEKDKDCEADFYRKANGVYMSLCHYLKG